MVTDTCRHAKCKICLRMQQLFGLSAPQGGQHWRKHQFCQLCHGHNNDCIQGSTQTFLMPFSVSYDKPQTRGKSLKYTCLLS